MGVVPDVLCGLGAGREGSPIISPAARTRRGQRRPLSLPRGYSLPSLDRVTLSQLPPMDVAAVRTEIKAWEYAFKAEHGRHPTIQDIKDQPPIGLPCHTPRLPTHLLTPILQPKSTSSTRNSTRPSSPPPRRPRHPSYPSQRQSRQPHLLSPTIRSPRSRTRASRDTETAHHPTLLRCHQAPEPIHSQRPASPRLFLVFARRESRPQTRSLLSLRCLSRLNPPPPVNQLQRITLSPEPENVSVVNRSPLLPSRKRERVSRPRPSFPLVNTVPCTTVMTTKTPPIWLTATTKLMSLSLTILPSNHPPVPKRTCRCLQNPP